MKVKEYSKQKQNGGVVEPPSGAPEHPVPKSVRVGVLLQSVRLVNNGKTET